MKNELAQDVRNGEIVQDNKSQKQRQLGRKEVLKVMFYNSENKILE